MSLHCPSVLSVLPIVAIYWGRAPSTFGDSVFASPAAAIGSILGLALPASFAYAILRHRLFDVRLMLRLGLQYALARQVLISIVPLMGAVFLADLWLNRQTSFAEILQARGWAYAGLAMLALVARLRRNQWLEALDRRYFRERLNAQRLLRGIGEEIRNATALDDNCVGSPRDDLAPDRRDHPIASRSAAPWAWQMATASASAAWSGSGGAGSASSEPTIR